MAKKDSLEYVLRERITNDLFISPRTKAVHNFVQHHFTTSGKYPTLKVLQTEFPKVVFQEPESTIEWVIDKLRDRYQRNEVSDLTMELANSVDKPKEAMKILRHKVLEIERNSLSSRHVWKPGDHKLFIHNLQQRVLEGHYQGVTCGFSEIDKFTGGYKKGNAVYYLARPKRKKTFFTLLAFIAQTVTDEAPYLSTLENTEEEIMLRVSCMLSGFPWNDAQQGNLMPKDYKLLDKAWDSFSEHKFHLEQPAMDERTVSSMFLKADNVAAGPVIISQFSYILGSKDAYQAEHLKHAEIAQDLKRFATRPGVERPVLVEAQFNRGGDSMEELQDFTCSKVGLTDMIGQSADTLFGLFESKDMRANNIIEFGILEARNHDKAAWFIETELNSRTEFRLVTGSQH